MTSPEQPSSHNSQTSPFAGMSSTEMSAMRTDLAVDRTDLAEIRTELARDRNRAAEERTLLAWIRTSLSMISFGFGIDRFFQYLKKTDAPSQLNQMSEERLIGLSLMILGVVALAGALISHWNILKRIEQRDYKYTPNASFGFSIGIVLLFIGIVAFAPLILAEVQLGEIFSLSSPFLKSLAGITIFILMLTMGIAIPLNQLFGFFQQKPGLLARSLLSVLVLYPLAVAGLLYLFDLSSRSNLALVLLAAAPAAPLLTKKAGMAGTNPSMIAGLQVVLASSAVIITPLLLTVFAAIFPDTEAKIATLSVAKQIAIVQLLPLGIGILVRWSIADLADEVSSLMITIANTLFWVLAAFLVALSINLLPQISLQSLSIFAIVVILGLAIGHSLGGPELESRSALATATIARNAGLAFFIALANNQSASTLPIFAYVIISTIIALPYQIWVKRQLTKQASTNPIAS
jgi:uncharacterized membrane protein YidH (DUF202 family)